jgi:RimJ/RimL family protein N-acetyltransferase
VRAFAQLSPQSRYFRFFSPKRELSAEEIRYFTEVDGMNHFALGALVDRPDGTEEGVGIARFIRMRDNPLAAEAAVTVIDSYQRKGLGTLLTQQLFSAAAERGLEELQFFVLESNHSMLAIIRKIAPAAHSQRDVRFGAPVAKFVAPLPVPADPSV